jgi:predicted Fe-S protein YdhL (DUF1289 family)
MDERSPVSPCVGICLVDPATRQCRGCLRTVDEIARWYEASTAEKRELLAILAVRRARLTVRKRND